MGLKSERVVIVTGASRGVGKGIALALGASGATVYVTGRARQEGQTTSLPGTIDRTADEVTARGGKGIAAFCDHGDDEQICELIQRVISEQGRLDILVNNVFQVPDDLLEWKPFWERPVNAHWDAMIGIGLRAHYVAAYHAAPHMVAARSGLIVNISSPGARAYLHSAIYGIGKAGTDKMIHDIGKELRDYDVCAVALWPGIVKTERLQPAIDADELSPEYEALKPGMETPEFSGRLIDAIASKDDYMQFAGRSYWNSELGIELGVNDADGSQPESYAPFLGEALQPPEAMIK